MDFKSKILYWVDALEDTIESVTINGDNRRVVSSENVSFYSSIMRHLTSIPIDVLIFYIWSL